MIGSAAHRWSVWLPPLGLMLVSALACAWLALQSAPGSNVVALLFPPWWSAARVFMAAAPAGQVIRFGLFPDIVILAPQPGGLPPGATGAWAVLDPRHLGGCGAVSVQEVQNE